MDTRWSKSVTLALEGPDIFTTIDSTQAAAWAMIEDWPLEDGPALDHALLVCTEVMDGKRPNDQARPAFLAAAREANLPIKD